uniref:Uncharacterized protein n=1 Tax=Salix viminalis TaxID=40686 RepID=A0A6N2M6V1_SALVM
MKVGEGVFYGAPRATSFLLSHRRRTTLRTFSCSSFPVSLSSKQPPFKSCCLKSLVTGESIVSPRSTKGLFPLAIPLARSSSDGVTALQRCPTAPLGMEIPVVEVRKHGVWLLAKTVDQYINRILVEEDADISSEANADLFLAAADAGDNLYTKGDYAKSHILDLDAYLLKKVGLFPDVIERKVMLHLQKGDHIALDEAAFLLDLASVEGTWDETAEQVAECYKQAGLHDVARFIQYRD